MSTDTASEDEPTTVTEPQAEAPKGDWKEQADHTKEWVEQNFLTEPQGDRLVDQAEAKAAEAEGKAKRVSE